MTKNASQKAILAAARRGPLRARDLDLLGIHRRHLRQLCDTGALEKIGHGLYIARQAPPTELHTVAQVCKRLPHAIVCLLTALQIHALSTEASAVIWIMIDRKARAPEPSTPRLEIIRASGPARTHGVE